MQKTGQQSEGKSTECCAGSCGQLLAKARTGHPAQSATSGSETGGSNQQLRPLLRGGAGEGTHERQDGTLHPRVRGGGVIEPRARRGGGETAASQPAEGDASAPFAVLAWRGGGTLVLACAGPGPMTCRFTGTNSKPRPDRRNGKITEDCRASHAKTQAPERRSHRMLHDAATAGPQQPDTAPQKKNLSTRCSRRPVHQQRGGKRGGRKGGGGDQCRKQPRPRSGQPSEQVMHKPNGLSWNDVAGDPCRMATRPQRPNKRPGKGPSRGRGKGAQQHSHLASWQLQ